MTDMKRLAGGCHCGNLQLSFETALPLQDFRPRACDCSFCLKHGASYISDPAGHLSIAGKARQALRLYRQGSEHAEFVLCNQCGVLVAVVFGAQGQLYGAVNTRCLEDRSGFGQEQAASPQSLSATDKQARWQALWTPNVVMLIEGERYRGLDATGSVTTT